MKYKVVRDCHFASRYWNQGEIADFETDPKNEHFEIFEGPIEKDVPVVEVPTTMYEIGKEQRKLPNTGMGHMPEQDDEYEKRTVS